MRRSLLIASVVITSLSMAAQERGTSTLPTAQQWNNFQIEDISPDGNYAFSARMGEIAILNLYDGTSQVFGGNADPTNKKKGGYGHLFSTTGVVIANGYPTDAPFYYKDGEWHSLPVPNPELTASANSINPDGTIIVGTVSLPAAKEGETPVPTQAAAVWTLQSDGTYAEAQVLPWPEKDLTGRLPQYVLGLAVSDDGKSVGALYTDRQGQMNIPLLYTLGDDNEWSYQIVCENLLNQDDVTLVPFPDPFTDPKPLQTDFMTEKELADYQEAYDAWIAAGTWDFNTRPTYEQYMSEEELEDFQDALSDWELDQKEWSLKNSKALEAYNKMKACSVDASYFSFMMAPDGKRAVTTGRLTVPTSTGSTEVVSVPVVYNLEDGSSKIFSDFRKATVSGIDNAYNVYSARMLGDYSSNPPVYTTAFVSRGGESDFVSFEEWVSFENAEAGQWIKEHIYHDMTVTVGGESKTVNIPIAGKPRVSADGTVASCATTVTWKDDVLTSGSAVSYTVPLSITTSVNQIEAEDLNIQVLRNGQLMINENVDEVVIYDLSGRIVYKTAPAQNIINSGLEEGLYVVRATLTDGSVKAAKVMF